MGERRWIFPQGFDECVHRGRIAFHFGHQAGRRVQDVARQVEFERQVVDERPEPDSLNDAAQANANAPAASGGWERLHYARRKCSFWSNGTVQSKMVLQVVPSGRREGSRAAPRMPGMKTVSASPW